MRKLPGSCLILNKVNKPARAGLSPQTGRAPPGAQLTTVFHSTFFHLKAKGSRWQLNTGTFSTANHVLCHGAYNPSPKV